MTLFNQIEAALAEMSAREVIARVSANEWHEQSDLSRAIAALRVVLSTVEGIRCVNFSAVAKALAGEGEKK